MQKIELRNNLNAVIQGLKTNEIIALLSQSTIDKHHFLKFLIDSKAGYDQASTDPNKLKVFDQFDTKSMYSSDNFTNLISIVSSAGNNNRATFLGNNAINNFYSFHKTLVSTFNIIDKLLFESSDIFQEEYLDVQKNQNRGNLMLQIIDDEKVDLKKFSEIVDALDELIKIVYLLFEKIEGIEFEDHPKIEMVDSGSDINFVIKLPEKAANLIAQLFKQMWDVVINNKSYRYRQRLKDLEKTITVVERVNEAKGNGSIEPEMAEVLKRGLIENAEKIIFRNTVTKQIVLESVEYSNRQILIEKTNTLLLEEVKPLQEENTN